MKCCEGPTCQYAKDIGLEHFACYNQCLYERQAKNNRFKFVIDMAIGALYGLLGAFCIALAGFVVHFATDAIERSFR